MSTLLPSTTLGVEADTWAAIESMATTAALLLGAAAAVYGWLQLRQGAAARLDQNRPYVLLTLAPARMLGHVDFLVQNLGAGPAHDVRITVEPGLERADEIEGMPVAKARFFNEPMPLMPPGYELRSYFDSLADRKEKGLPQRYTFTISYNDGHGHHWTEASVQDLGHLDDLLFSQEYKLHDAAVALRDISAVLKKSALLKTGEVTATTETRADRVTRREAESKALRERRAAMEQRVRQAQQPAPDADRPDPA